MTAPAETRARDLGVPFDGEPGAWNAITDVPGLEVGFATIVEDEPVVARTGVTAILPRGRAAAGSPCAAGVAVLNGNGELTGRSWIEEAGQFQTRSPSRTPTPSERCIAGSTRGWPSTTRSRPPSGCCPSSARPGTAT